METFVLQAEKREVVGKTGNKRLRREGYMPAVVYGGSRDVVAIQIEHNSIMKSLDVVGFYSNILELHLDGKSEKVYLKDLRRHPSKKEILHADFQRVEEAVELNIRVPIRLLNEDKCVGVKQGGGVVSRLITEIEITCLPKNLPPSIEIDIENLNVGEAIHFSDLKMPEGVSLTALIKGGDEMTGVVQVMTPKGIEIDDEVVEEEQEPGEAAAEEESAEEPSTE